MLLCPYDHLISYGHPVWQDSVLYLHYSILWPGWREAFDDNRQKRQNRRVPEYKGFGIIRHMGILQAGMWFGICINCLKTENGKIHGLRKIIHKKDTN